MKTLKRILAIAAALTLLGSVSLAETQEPVEIIVFAAASMKETLTELKAVYEAENPGVTIVYNFDSSGTLKTQIESGADCDVFISASPKQMNQLDKKADPAVNTAGLDFVLEGTRIDLLENKVALAVPEGDPKDVRSYDDLVKGLTEGTLLLAMGNADVPVGQYTQKIFAFYGLDENALAASGVLTYGSNVKEVTTQVSEAAVDCGIMASILGASTRSVGDRAYGYMLLDIPGTPEELARAISYLSATPDITVQVEAEYAAKGVEA